MAKVIKGDPRRTPPEPGQSSDIDEWFGTLMPSIQTVVRQVDESIRAAIPNLDYAVKYQRAFYGLPELGWIIELAPYAVSANVLFLGGADFEHPPVLGSADRTRYVKVRTLAEATEPTLLEWIAEAGRAPGWK